MDNLSHSVVGLATGEFIHRSLRQESDINRQQARRYLLLISCWAASNFPDLDIFFTQFLPAPLGYLLHHRGHTHTLLYAIPQAILLWAVICLCWPSARKLLKESTSARTGFIISLGLGFTLHILMDYLNSYGIHPFHPFDSRWLYGDMVFILEPFFWIVFGVPMAMMVQRLVLKILLIGLLAGVPLFFTVRGFLPWGSLAVLMLLAIAIGALQHRAGMRGKSALVLAFGLSIGFVGMQDLASSKAKRIVSNALYKKDPATQVLDISMSSFPANPLCWAFVSIESNEDAGTYRLRRGILSLASAILPATECPASLSERPFQKSMTPTIVFSSAYQGSLDALRALKNENCYFEAWLRFARAPSLDGTKALDIRFGSDPEGNFTAINLADFEKQTCSHFIPDWDFPRSDLVTPRALPVKR